MPSIPSTLYIHVNHHTIILSRNRSLGKDRVSRTQHGLTRQPSKMAISAGHRRAASGDRRAVHENWLAQASLPSPRREQQRGISLKRDPSRLGELPARSKGWASRLGEISSRDLPVSSRLGEIDSLGRDLQVPPLFTTETAQKTNQNAHAQTLTHSNGRSIHKINNRAQKFQRRTRNKDSNFPYLERANETSTRNPGAP